MGYRFPLIFALGNVHLDDSKRKVLQVFSFLFPLRQVLFAVRVSCFNGYDFTDYFSVGADASASDFYSLPNSAKLFYFLSLSPNPPKRFSLRILNGLLLLWRPAAFSESWHRFG